MAIRERDMPHFPLVLLLATAVVAAAGSPVTTVYCSVPESATQGTAFCTGLETAVVNAISSDGLAASNFALVPTDAAGAAVPFILSPGQGLIVNATLDARWFPAFNLTVIVAVTPTTTVSSVTAAVVVDVTSVNHAPEWANLADFTLDVVPCGAVVPVRPRRVCHGRSVRVWVSVLRLRPAALAGGTAAPVSSV